VEMLAPPFQIIDVAFQGNNVEHGILLGDRKV
jgi:hypothetical protein